MKRLPLPGWGILAAGEDRGIDSRRNIFRFDSPPITNPFLKGPGDHFQYL